MQRRENDNLPIQDQYGTSPPAVGGINEVMMLPCFENQAFNRGRVGADDRQQSLRRDIVAKTNV